METNREWMSISDMMAGLMMVFLFIAILFMIETESDKKAMEEIAITYDKTKQELYRDLLKEFQDDLDEWGAEILPDNTVRFNEPDILFARSSSQINKRFENILQDFFPRYINILTMPKYVADINEIRIEGHTSSIWRPNTSLEDTYLKNSRLSQDRSFSVLQYIYTLPISEGRKQWLTGVIRANGLSYARLIYHKNGEEDFARSRRVEFRVITKTEEKIYEILERAQL